MVYQRYIWVSFLCHEIGRKSWKMIVSLVLAREFYQRILCFQLECLSPYGSVTHYFLEKREKTWKKNSYPGCRVDNSSSFFVCKTAVENEIRGPPVLQFYQDTKDWRMKG